MTLSSITVYMIVIIVFVQQVNGSGTLNCEVILITDDKHQEHGGYAAEEPTKCCGDSICQSFIHALDHLTSGIIMNVTTNVKLSSIKSLKNLRNVTIFGHNNPTVACSNGGGLHFYSCHNCTIEGITWEGCGVAQSKTVEPAIQFHNQSSNITIQNCSFRHSIGQAVLLLNMSGHVHINHCKFVENTHYRGHGAAMHYSSGTAALVFTITYCNFSHNKVIGEGKKSAGSILYIGKSLGESGSRNVILIKDTSFGSNRGSYIFVSMQNVHIDGTVVFENNKAYKGGVIVAVDYSNVTFDKNSKVTFTRNKAIGNGHGGQMFLTDLSNILFEQTSVVVFNSSKATNGDAVYLGKNSSVSSMYPTCHPGFYYDPKSQKCKCFDNNIVFCYGSSSTIQRGYWFGEVDGKSTVAHCPVNYCEFTGCNTAVNLCPLSPERTNQCRSHRSGTACGDCAKGYTLPYYSTECINRDNCTALWTSIVILLTVVYWIVLVIAVFTIAHYKVSIGYLYAITYYYSVVDVLLSDYWYIPNGFYIIINIMYSIFKMMPQFLGKLCLVEGLSGIDQQFIHYIHPLAISLMLIMITVLARFSHRLSAFIHRDAVRIICFLLLLSYTLVTFTSMLLITSLKFFDVDKIYTYISPNIEYFHSRHLTYGIIALLCIIFIVIGLPLILITEPLLGQKVSFARLKPFLDQFQQCYKHKYRWFASYYMICRIAIITIMIVFSSNGFTSRYLLITICAAVFLIHLSIRPYNSKILNAFDGMILLLLVLVPILLLVKVINSNSVVPITLVLLVLPLSILCLIIYKDAIKNLFSHVVSRLVGRDVRDYDAILENPTADDDVDLIVDDNMRMNTTTCDVRLDTDSTKDANQY